MSYKTIDRSKPKKEIAYHHHLGKNISIRETGHYEECIQKPSDFIKDQILFISLVAQNWIPFHLKDEDLGVLQLIHFTYEKKLILPNQDDYLDLFEFSDINRYYLTDKGKALVKQGFDFIVFEGDELGECFIANPKEQVTKIESITLKRKINDFHI